MRETYRVAPMPKAVAQERAQFLKRWLLIGSGAGFVLLCGLVAGNLQAANANGVPTTDTNANQVIPHPGNGRYHSGFFGNQGGDNVGNGSSGQPVTGSGAS